MGRYLAPIWQKHATIKPTALPIEHGGEKLATPDSPHSYPDAPSAVQKPKQQELDQYQHIQVPTEPGELFGGDFYVPPPFMGDFSDHESQCKQDSLSLSTCQQNLKAANKAVKSGFWNRLRSGIKHSGCGALGGGSGVVVGETQKSVQAGAITGGLTWLGCELLAR